MQASEDVGISTDHLDSLTLHLTCHTPTLQVEAGPQHSKIVTKGLHEILCPADRYRRFLQLTAIN